MESSGFQAQMLSIMEVLAQAAAAEIHRRVDDSCAVLRLELSHSRRDIEGLKKKCGLMEAELRRSRIRVRRKGFSFSTAASVRRSQNQNQSWTAQIYEPDQPEQSDLQEALQVPAEVQVKEEEEWQYEDSEKLETHESQTLLESTVKQELLDVPYETLIPPLSSEQSEELELELEQEQEIPPLLASQSTSQSITMVTQTWTHQNDEDDAPLLKAQLQLGRPGPPPGPAPDLPPFHSRGSRRTRVPWRSCSGERPYGCTYCHKSFMLFNHLKEHMRCHTGEKPYSCQQCGRRFTKQFNLLRHAVVHSGEKPFRCSLCGKCFTQNSGLKSHQKNAH